MKTKPKKIVVLGMTVPQARAFIEAYRPNGSLEFAEIRAKKEGVEMTIEQANRLYDAATEPRILTAKQSKGAMKGDVYSCETDNSGQLVFYTGIYRWSDGTLRDGEENE